MATPLDGGYTKEEVFRIPERTLTMWKEQGTPGERFGLFQERVGVDNLVAQLKEGL